MNSSEPSLDLQRQICVMLSIKPKYASAIIRGEKKFEYRRNKFSKHFDTVIMYVTSPVKKVIAEFDVERVITNTPINIWNETFDFAGIDRDSFFNYFKGKDIGYAIKIGEIRKYKKPLNLEDEYGIKPPQSFAYINK